MGAESWDVYWDLASQDWTLLSEAQLALVAVGELRTEVNNGGFHQYFFNSSGDLAETALAALEALGIEPLAQLLRQAIGVAFGADAPYPTDHITRQEQLVGSDEGFDVLDALGARYYTLEESLDLDAVMTSLAARL